MPKRYFTDEVLKEWIRQDCKYVLFTDVLDENHILVRPINKPEDLIGITLYESHLLPVLECNEVAIQSISFIDHSVKLVCFD
jgi:hypothetical protein